MLAISADGVSKGHKGPKSDRTQQRVIKRRKGSDIHTSRKKWGWQDNFCANLCNSTNAY